MLVWLFENSHNGPINSEFPHFFVAIASAVFSGFYLWLLYVALEPFVRRRLPQRIVSWSRLLRGDYRDPLVGRDILIGAAAGGVITLTDNLTPFILRSIGRPYAIMSNPGSALLGSLFWGRFASQLTAALFLSFIPLFLLLLFVVILRREWLAMAVLFVLVTMFGTLVGNSTAIGVPAAMLQAAITLGILYRFGLLALVATLFFVHLWVFYPMTTDFGAWYAIDFLIGAIISLALAAYAFYISLGGQKVFAERLWED